MPENDPDKHEVRSGALDGLEDRLDAFEAKRSRRISSDQAGSIGAGYRFLASMLGGVLSGIGFGWLLDHYAGTAPWGVVGGLLIGSAVSIFSVVRTAGRMSEAAAKANPPPEAAAFDDEDED
jgi:ATP synthase protein I